MYRSHGLRGNTAVDALRTLAVIETQIVETQLLRLYRLCIPKPERGNDD